MNPAATAGVTLVRGASLVASPWKNGGGVTREIAVWPEAASLDAFAWRLSVADVGAAGPFSRFAGIDRMLVLLEGEGMLLDEAGGHTHALLQPLDVARFAGETDISARLVGATTRDFNVMVRREAVRADLQIWRTATTHQVAAGTTLWLYCAQGTVGAGLRGQVAQVLAEGDALRIDAAQDATLETHGKGALIAVTLTEISNQN